jgi:hypothetical protein
MAKGEHWEDRNGYEFLVAGGGVEHELADRGLAAVAGRVVVHSEPVMNVVGEVDALPVRRRR